MKILERVQKRPFLALFEHDQDRAYPDPLDQDRPPNGVHLPPESVGLGSPDQDTSARWTHLGSDSRESRLTIYSEVGSLMVSTMQARMHTGLLHEKLPFLA
jgi:hypothetical protein